MRRHLLIAVVIVLFSAAHAHSCGLIARVPVGNTYPPFFIQDKNGQWGGVAVELAQVLADEAGCKITFMPLPFPRSLAFLEQGKIHMAMNLTITEERSRYLYFIGPQLDETVVLVVHRDSDFKIDSLDDLMQLPGAIGVEKGKVYGKRFEQRRAADPAFAHKFDPVVEVNLNERKLKNKRIAGFLGYAYNVYYRLKTNPLYKDFKVHPFVINQDWVYFGLSKKAVSPEMLDRLQKAFDRASREGRFEAIRRRYKTP